MKNFDSPFRVPRLPLVLSFPRSGMNWLRHATESQTGYRTPGKGHFVWNINEFPFVRSHNIVGQKGESNPPCKFDRILLLLRNPAESYMRFPTIFTTYCSNILFFERFDGPTKRVYFDDIFSKAAIYDIWDWFELSYKPIDDFGKLLTESRKWYKKRWGLRNLVVDPKLRAEAMQECVEKLGAEIYEKHLTRWDT